MTTYTICSAVKLNVLLGAGGEACFKMDAYETCFWTTCCLKASQDSLCSWRHEVPYNLHTSAFFSLYLDSFCVNTLLVFDTVWCLVPKALTLKTLKDRGCCLKFLNPGNCACFLAYESPERSASACFGLSLLILAKGRYLSDLSNFIRSASAWLILLKSSSSLKSSSVMLQDTPLKTETFPFEASTKWYDFGSDTLTFGTKTCCILDSLCRIAKSLGVSPMKIHPFCDCLIWKTLRLGWYCLSSLVIRICVLNFG